MANKKNGREQLAARRERLYKEACNATSRLHIISICVIVFALLMLLVSFTSIHNTTMNDGAGGTEVSVSGWSFFLAGLTGDFEAAQKIYGAIGVFYYWAPEITKTLSMLMIIAVFAIVLTLVLEIVTLVTKQHFLTVISMLFGALGAALLMVVYVRQFAYTNPVVLNTPSYCNGNTACSIRSAALIPFVVLLLFEAVDVFVCLKLRKAKRDYAN